MISGLCGNNKAKRVKERYDARQYVAPPSGARYAELHPVCLVLGAWSLWGWGVWPSMSKLRFGMAVLGLLHPYIVRRRWNSFPCFSSFSDRLSSTQAVVFISRGTLMLHLLAWPLIHPWTRLSYSLGIIRVSPIFYFPWIRAQVWPSWLEPVSQKATNLTPDPTNITRDYSWLVNWIRAQAT